MTGGSGEIDGIFLDFFGTMADGDGEAVCARLVVRTSVEADTLDANETVRAYKAKRKALTIHHSPFTPLSAP